MLTLLTQVANNFRRRRLNLAPAAAASAIVLALLAPAKALPIVQPYVSVTVSTTALNLGHVSLPGTYNSPAMFTVQVSANCNYGSVTLSASALASGENLLPLSRFMVKAPITGNFVPLSGPIAVSTPGGPGRQTIPLQFQVQTLTTDVAGTYQGTIVVTCSPAP